MVLAIWVSHASRLHQTNGPKHKIWKAQHTIIGEIKYWSMSFFRVCVCFCVVLAHFFLFRHVFEAIWYRARTHYTRLLAYCFFWIYHVISTIAAMFRMTSTSKHFRLHSQIHTDIKTKDNTRENRKEKRGNQKKKKHNTNLVRNDLCNLTVFSCTDCFLFFFFFISCR